MFLQRPPDTASDTAPNAASGETMMSVSGEGVYAARCAGCHGAAGGGGAGPRMAENARAADADYVARVVRNGRGMMPAFGNVLSDAEVEAVVQYTVGLSRGGQVSQAGQP